MAANVHRNVSTDIRRSIGDTGGSAVVKNLAEKITSIIQSVSSTEVGLNFYTSMPSQH